MSRLRLVESRAPVLVQDLGRPGWAHLGVPPSGALDPAALALANRLVGNRDGVAGLELLLGGCVFAAQGSMRIAVTGAVVPLRVGGRPVGWGEPISVRDGEPIEVGTARDGLRSWLAVAGGVDVPEVLGSRSTDTLTGLGPAPLTGGDTVHVGVPADVPAGGEAIPERYDVEAWTMGVRLGPRSDWFVEAARGLLTTGAYVVTPASSRVALRLEGPRLERRRTEELPSEGLVTGAVQVPAGGDPLVFLADHPVTGGYPVIAVVDRRGLAACAQARPGDRVRFALR
ncbi:MAG: biotin-dependent carboxyltransferase family protein [Nocardioidaceae bacterium]|nr:biotin-dependent carboxyltransferase family protein [Nocardioidaceae bacterium]